MTTGELIKIYAVEKGYSIRRLAMESGVNYNTLYAIVSRKSNRVSKDTINKIASTLNISPKYLNIEPKPYKISSIELELLQTIKGMSGPDVDSEKLIRFIITSLEINRKMILQIFNTRKEE